MGSVRMRCESETLLTNEVEAFATEELLVSKLIKNIDDVIGGVIKCFRSKGTSTVVNINFSSFFEAITCLLLQFLCLKSKK